MEKELRSFLIWGAIVFAVFFFLNIFLVRINELKDKLSIAESNNKTLLIERDEAVDKAGRLTVGVQGLIVDKKELEKVNHELSVRIKDMSMNYNKASSAAQIIASENTRLKSKLKDSVVVRIIKDTVIIDTLKCFSRVDDYSIVSGCVGNDTIDISMSSVVPLNIIMTNVYRHKFLWWRWGVVNQKLTVSSDNPNVTFPSVKLYIPK